MGEVYEAERADGQYEQRAALKLTRREAAKLLDRFNAERRILARLDHPGIARLLDGGISPDGRPYAVMEYVEGQCITRYCDTMRASRARLAPRWLSLMLIWRRKPSHAAMLRQRSPRATGRWLRWIA
jgi:eukaryotic-like serine/threonine-protein kinase